MVKIIIVDDDQKEHTLIKKIIKPLFFQYEETIKTYSFKKYNHELEQLILDNSERKIFLLDINLNSKITGLNIAQKIREQDWDSEIIFFTSHDQYFNKVHRSIFRIFDFIEKFDHLEERLIKDLDTILSMNFDNATFKYKNNQIDLRLYLKDILYIYRVTDERKLIIKTTHNSFKVNKTLDDILKELDNRFIRVHRSCIINKDKVSKLDWNNGYFKLDNGEKVYMLSKKYKEVVNL